MCNFQYVGLVISFRFASNGFLVSIVPFRKFFRNSFSKFLSKVFSKFFSKFFPNFSNAITDDVTDDVRAHDVIRWNVPSICNKNKKDHILCNEVPD